MEDERLEDESGLLYRLLRVLGIADTRVVRLGGARFRLRVSLVHDGGDGQSASRIQVLPYIGHELRGFGEVMVDIDHHQTVDGARQAGVVFAAEDSRQVGDAPFPFRPLDLANVLLGDFVRVDAPLGSDSVGHLQGEVPASGAHLGHRHAGVDVQQVQQEIVERPGVLRRHDAGRQGRDGQADQPHPSAFHPHLPTSSL